MRISEQHLRAAAWALVGAMVALYAIVAAIAGIGVDDAPVATGIVAGAAGLWLAHAWRRLQAGGVSPRQDRERRGF